VKDSGRKKVDDKWSSLQKIEHFKRMDAKMTAELENSLVRLLGSFDIWLIDRWIRQRFTTLRAHTCRTPPCRRIG